MNNCPKIPLHQCRQLTFILLIVFYTAILSTLLSSFQANASGLTQVIYPKYSQRSEFYSQVLALALKKTEPEYGDYELSAYQHVATTERLRRSLMNGKNVTVLWSSSSKARNEKYLPVKVNLLKGLNRYRFIVIRSEDKNRFQDVNSLSQLRTFKAGSGKYWSDTKVLVNNDLPVVTSLNPDLLALLNAYRFDYAPRGAYEVWSELAKGEGKFVIHDNIILSYPGNYYFYLKKDNLLLAERLEKGLKLALADGSYDKLFFSVPDFKLGWDKVHHNQYKVIRLSKNENY